MTRAPAPGCRPRRPCRAAPAGACAGRGGVVLLEALLALAIFALAVLGLATALNSAVTYAREARLAAAITRELENVLEEMLHQPLIEEGEWVVTRTPEDSLLPVPLTVTTRIAEAEFENEDGEPLGGLFEMEIIAVAVDAQRREMSWELRTLVYPPIYAGTR
jgi:type II secretory pathway pseudopilin PulG